MVCTGKDDGKALIWSKDSVETRRFDASKVVWRDSELRTYLNGGWLDGKTTLQEKAVETDITTRIINTDTFNTTQDKVFLLSEADLFGTHSYNQTPTDSKDYTYNGRVCTKYRDEEVEYHMLAPLAGFP